MAKSPIGVLSEYGFILENKILRAGGCHEDARNVCFKFGQYCFMYGIKREYIGLFFKIWQKGDKALQLPTSKYAELLCKRFITGQR
jgi:hypothetical protein